MGGGSDVNPFAGSGRELAVLRTKKLFLSSSYTVVALSVTAIITLLLINLSPTGWGWLLLLINGLTVGAGLTGILSKKYPSCYSLLIVLSTITGVLQGISALGLFTRTGNCLADLNPLRINDYDGRAIVKFYAFLALLLCCVLWILLGLACIIHQYMFSDFYEHTEDSKRATAKVQEEPYQRSFRVEI